jgi:hypothetical protein
MSDKGSMKFGLQCQVFLRPTSFGTEPLEIDRQNVSGTNSEWSCDHSDRMVSPCRFYVSSVCVTIETIHFAGSNLIRGIFPDPTCHHALRRQAKIVV